jgi:hypothetical protein
MMQLGAAARRGNGPGVEATMIKFSEWLKRLREMHLQARAGVLDAKGLALYRSVREEFFQSLLVAQQIAREYGHTARQTMRIAWAMQVDLDPARECVRVVTLDLSSGGFSALMGTAPSKERELAFSMRLPGSAPVSGTARVIASVPRPGNCRVSFSFVALGADDMERLKQFMLEKVLAVLPVGEDRVASAA